MTDKSQTTEVASHFGPDGLRISTRALNCLQYDEITTIQQVRSIGYAGLVRMPNMGVRCAKEVWEAAYSDQAERLLQQTTTREVGVSECKTTIPDLDLPDEFRKGVAFAEATMGARYLRMETALTKIANDLDASFATRHTATEALKVRQDD